MATSNHSTPNPILRDAMLALHDELASLEVDSANALNTKAAVLVPRWQAQHDKLALFFDWSVFFDEPVTLVFESPPCAHINPRVPLRDLVVRS